MELSVLKNFMRMNVEILVGGSWILGNLASIEKGVITMLPVGTEQEFYGPTALKIEAVQAIRQVKCLAPPAAFENPNLPAPVRSAFQSTLPGTRAKIVND